jgi:N-methylhydantoinase A
VGHRVAIDIGGTFTDLVVQDARAARTAKVLSTPPNLVRGVLELLDLGGGPPGEIDLFVHGTTAGLNALLERRVARVALATTRGFRDTYLIGRGHRPEMYDLRYRKPAPLLQRDAIFELDERLAADGSVLEPLDETSVQALADAVEEGGYDAVAVCLLHSYLNPAHERRVRELLAGRLPKVAVVTSHEVAPEWREYERTSTTVMSAYITPIMRSYLDELADAADGRRPAHPRCGVGGDRRLAPPGPAGRAHRRPHPHRGRAGGVGTSAGRNPAVLRSPRRIR